MVLMEVWLTGYDDDFALDASGGEVLGIWGFASITLVQVMIDVVLTVPMSLPLFAVSWECLRKFPGRRDLLRALSKALSAFEL